MGAELVVMTDEHDGDKFRVYRRPLDQLDDIPRTGTLFIIVSCEDAARPRLNGRRRLVEAHGRDRYAVVLRGGMVMLRSWDDGDIEWKRLNDPWAESATTRPDHLPLVRAAITFAGILLPAVEWQRAVAQFNEEMH